MKSKKPKFPAFGQRQSILAEQRSLKMARSAHAYVRGNTRKFYEWLQTSAGQEFLEPFENLRVRQFGGLSSVMPGCYPNQ
jgi:Uncharacterized protein conserved in bacteria (DUF2252)